MWMDSSMKNRFNMRESEWGLIRESGCSLSLNNAEESFS